jgi:hypothetical protein
MIRNDEKESDYGFVGTQFGNNAMAAPALPTWSTKSRHNQLYPNASALATDNVIVHERVAEAVVQSKCSSSSRTNAMATDAQEIIPQDQHGRLIGVYRHPNFHVAAVVLRLDRSLQTSSRRTMVTGGGRGVVEQVVTTARCHCRRLVRNPPVLFENP